MNWPRAIAKRPEGTTAKRFQEIVFSRKKIELGRRGWLDQVRLGIVEYESKLYLSRYGE